ncbi:MAG: MBL fold metallo-hydrolase, partial [Actinobacteria bacterium]|nr:MBL fold metallo-hydrolase [Actinomycetota bacterium]
ATGALLARWPDLPDYVHERGAPHIVDPSRLLASAERLYGDKLEYLWGKIQPVPEANVTALAGGEVVRGMRVAYTPGHASHHVSYLHEETGTAFVGDVAACRIPPTNLIVPPTPPPDIDVELWEDSIATIESWDPTTLALTHFGPVDEPAAHLAEAKRRLREEADLVREMDEPAYEADLQRRISEELDPEVREEMFQAVPTAYQWSGLDRYWRKKAEREA